MRSLLRFKLFIFSLLSAGLLHAAPLVDTVTVQGYLRLATNSPASDGAYQMAFGVSQNGVMIWAGKYTVTTSAGLFSQAIGGAGANLTFLPAATGMNADYSAVILNPSLLMASGSGELAVRVYAIDKINGFNSQFDIALSAVPTAFVADTAKQLSAGTLTLAMISPAAKASTSTGAADAGKIALLNGSGVLDSSLIPPLPASQIGSGSVAVGSGGTGSNNGSITGTGSVVYQSAAGASTTIGNNASASTLALQSGTGGITASVAGATGNVVISPGTASGTLTLGNATSSGASSIGNAGGASATTIQAGTGGILLSPAGTGIVRVTNGNGINLVHGTGSITLNAPINPTSYTFNLPANAGLANQFLMTNGSGGTSWGAPTLADLGAAASGANTDITSLDPEGTLTLGNTHSTTVNLGGAVTTTLNVGSAATAAETVTVGSTAGASATVIQAGTGKIKLASNGTTGVAFSSLGTCTMGPFTLAAGANAKTCANLPTGSAVYCSPSTSQGNKVTWGAWPSAAGTVTINMSAKGADATWRCMWVLP